MQVHTVVGGVLLPDAATKPRLTKASIAARASCPLANCTLFFCLNHLNCPTIGYDYAEIRAPIARYVGARDAQLGRYRQSIGALLNSIEDTMNAQPAQPQRIPSFRGVLPHESLAAELGPLQDLPGRWSGRGFNLIARPDFQGGNDIFLELNLTKEHIDFTAIGSDIPNRGSRQDDINLFGVTYLQQISQATPPGGALHIEPGIWLTIPPTTVPAAGPTITRLASIPHGDAINIQGTSISVDGGPTIDPTNTVPFPIGGTTPPPGTANGFPEYNLATPNDFRTSPIPAGITQAMIDNPNTVLTEALKGLKVLHTEVLIVSSTPSGGVQNIPFLVENANAAFVSAIFWIETVENESGVVFLQLQYTQTVLLDFRELSWPHVSVATLVRTF
jgi:hypothetical protein